MCLNFSKRIFFEGVVYIFITPTSPTWTAVQAQLLFLDGSSELKLLDASVGQ